MSKAVHQRFHTLELQKDFREIYGEHIPADVRREVKVACPTDKGESWWFSCADHLHTHTHTAAVVNAAVC